MLPARIVFAFYVTLVPVVGLAAAIPLAAQTPERSITIPRAERPPELDDFITDGRLGPAPEEPGTAIAVTGDPRGIRIVGFAQRDPGDGDPVSQPTAAYLSYDDANLYAVFVCHDDRSRVRANVGRREDIGEDDRVELYLDTFLDRQRAYYFATNPLGVQRDGIRSESTGDIDLSFDQVWYSDGRVVADGYVVRLAIPFRSLRFRSSGEQTWGVALGRIIQRANEEAYWPFITREKQGFIPQFGTMHGLTGISPGRNLQVNPYGMLARARVFDEDVFGHVNQGDERIGLDAKMVVRDALTLDATVNPDFSQVETDDPQVVVNERFEVFYPEKRPFFLENASYFETPERLFYSRRIIDPGLGLRATGKMGRWAIGALAMNDRADLVPDEIAQGDDAWIGAARVEREVGEESAVGFLVTDREFVNSQRYDRMFSADARLRFGENVELVGQAMRSENREHEGAGFGDWGFRADASYDSRALSSSVGYKEFGPDFAAPLGFVNRSDYRQIDADGEYIFRPESELVTEFGPSLSMKWLWDHESGVLQDREVEALFAIELIAATELEVSRVQAYELFEGTGFDIYANVVQFKTEWLAWLGGEVQYTWGTDVNHDPAEGLDPERGKATESEITIFLRPTNQLRVEGGYLHGSLDSERDAERLFTENKIRSKLNYQFNRELSLRAIFDVGWEDFNTELVDADDPRERVWAIDLLLTYLLHPGTAVYLGYTDAHENLQVVGSPPDEVIRSKDPDLSIGRQFFIKVSYLVRF